GAAVGNDDLRLVTINGCESKESESAAARDDEEGAVTRIGETDAQRAVVCGDAERNDTVDRRDDHGCAGNRLIARIDDGERARFAVVQHDADAFLAFGFDDVEREWRGLGDAFLANVDHRASNARRAKRNATAVVGVAGANSLLSIGEELLAPDPRVRHRFAAAVDDFDGDAVIGNDEIQFDLRAGRELAIFDIDV